MNKCVIEGCTCSTSKHDDGVEWVCRKHWRIVCPPRSRERKVYHAYFRKAKKLGLGDNDQWPPDLERSFWMFWRTLIKRGQRRCAGDALKAEVDRLFGWSE